MSDQPEPIHIEIIYVSLHRTISSHLLMLFTDYIAAVCLALQQLGGMLTFLTTYWLSGQILIQDQCGTFGSPRCVARTLRRTQRLMHAARALHLSSNVSQTTFIIFILNHHL